MNQSQGVTHTLLQQNHSTISRKACHWALLLALGLFVGAANSQAQTNAGDYIYTNTAAVGVWDNINNWTTQGVGGVTYPGNPSNPNGGLSDGAWFTNSGTFYVKLNSNLQVGSNFFSNASGTVQQVTLDIGANELNPQDAGNAVVIGNNSGSTSIVYMTSSPGGFGYVISFGLTIIGRNGYGQMIITNGLYTVSAGSGISLGTGTGGRGSLVLSGPNAVLNDIRLLTIGATTNVGGGLCSVTISNSASFTLGSSFRLGCTSSGGSSSNSFVLDSGGQASFGAGHAVAGKRGGTQGSYENSIIIKGGAGAIFNNHSLGIGWSDDDAGPGTNNSLTIIGSSSAITNISVLNLRHGNFINLYGGTVGGDFNGTTNGNIQVDGIFQGYGTIKGSINIITNGLLVLSNTVAQTTITRDLLMLTNSAAVQVTVGSGFNPTVVNHNIMLSGALNIIAGPGFGCGTNTLFTYVNNLISTNNDGSGTTNAFITVGTVPDGSKTYTIDTNTAGQVKLIISGCTVSDPFTTWQNQYFTIAELGTPSFSGPNADPFGKGMSNTNQFLAGFNPTNASAYVHITGITKTNSTDVRVDYLGASGDSTTTPPMGSRTNVLEFTTGASGNYNSNSFASTGITNILSGGTGLGTLSNMVEPGGATNKPARYYRVRVLVP